MTIAEPSHAAVAPVVVPEPPTMLFGRSFPYQYVVAAVFVSALFLDILDTTIVNVALPTLGRDLHTESVEWVVLGYTMSLAVCIPASGWLGDRFGTKRIFVGALAVFVGGSALCGIAQSIEQLIIFRLLQGAGGGMLTPVGTAMLFRAFPPAQRAKAATYIMIPTLAAPALGPVVGGFLVTNASWRWIFYINLPVGVAAFVFGLTKLREHREPSAGRFDRAGFVLSGAGLALVVYALSEGWRVGWTSPQVLFTGVGGMLCFGTMVMVERRKANPMLALRLLNDRMFRTCNMVSVFVSMSFFGLVFVLPLYLQNLRGLDALHSGLTTFPQAFGVLVSSQVAGRLYGRIGPRRLMVGGLVASAAFIMSFTAIGLHTSLWEIRLLLFGRGLTMGFAFVPMQAASYARIAPADNGRASSIFSTQRQMSISVGVALMATVLASFTPLSHAPTDIGRALTGYHLGFGLAAGFSLLAAVMALLIRDSDAEATMVPRVTAAPAA